MPPHEFAALSKEQQFAELLSHDLPLEVISERMGWTSRHVANAMLQRIRKKIGERAI